MPYAALLPRVTRVVCLLTLVLAKAEPSAQTARPISPLSVSPLYRSGSVWQRDVANVLRGEAGANEEVSFESEELGSASAKTDGAGKWSIALAAHRAGGPYAARLTAGEDTLRLDSIYVGDVFVCSGQSNMEWEVINATGGERDGPVYARPLKLAEGGGDITIQFSGVGAGLKAKQGQSISGFAIQDNTGRWTAAEAQLVASDRIRIASAPGHTITRVAYAWANNPAGANLVNGYNLPVSSFRLAVNE